MLQREPGNQWIVVLDDYHAIEASEVHETMTFLLDHLPDHLHLVIATRSDPPLPLARSRSCAQLTELRAAELRFTPSEAWEFLNRVMGLELTAADVDARQTYGRLDRQPAACRTLHARHHRPYRGRWLHFGVHR